MKGSKRIFAIFGIVLVLLGSLAVLAFLPGFQRFLFLNLLPEGNGRRYEIETLKIRPGTIIVEKFLYQDEGIGIRVEEVDLEVSLLAALFGKKIRLSKGVITGAKLDLSKLMVKPPLASEVSDSPSMIQDHRRIKGLLSTFDTDYLFWIGEIAIEGEIILPGERSVILEVDGHDIAPGQTGTLKFDGIFSDTSPDAPISKTEIEGSIEVTQRTESGLRELRLNLVVLADGPDTRASSGLNFRIGVKREEYSEEILVVVEDMGIHEERRQLLEIEAALDSASGSATGEYSVNLSRKDISFLSAGLPLPEFRARGSGKLSYDFNAFEGSISSDLEVVVTKLYELFPELSEVGELNMQSRMELAVEGGIVSVEVVSLSLGEDGGTNLLKCDTLKPFAIDLTQDELAIPDVEGELLSFKLSNFPFSWLAPWFVGESYSLTADAVYGEFVLSNRANRIRLAPLEKLSLEGLSIIGAGDVLLLSETDVSLTPTFTYGSGQTSVELKDFNVTAKEQTLVAGEGALDVSHSAGAKSSLSLSGRYVFHLSSWRDQPVVSAFRESIPDSKYSLMTDFEFSLSGDSLSLNSLRATLRDDESGNSVGNFELLDTLNLDLAGEWNSFPDFSGELLKIDFRGFPVNVLAPFIDNVSFDGEVIAGSLILSGEEGALQMDFAEPVSVSGFSMAISEKEVLRNVNFSGLPRVVYGQDRVECLWRDLKVSAGGEDVISGSGEFMFTPGVENPLRRAKFELESNLGLLLEQPVFAPYGNIKYGFLTLSGEVDLVDRKRVFARSRIRDLHTGGDAGAQLAVIEMELEGRLQGERFIAEIPLVATGVGGKTDVSLSATFDLGGEDLHFDLEAKGGRLSIDDMLTAAEAFSLRRRTGVTSVEAIPGSSSNQLEGSSDEPPRDEKPFWSGYVGRAVFDIEKVSHKSVGEFDDFSAVFNVQTDRLSVDRFRGEINGSPFDFRGTVRFEPRSLEPYSLAGEFTLQRFDAGEFYRKTRTGEKPLVEGLFTFQGRTEGEASTLAQLFERVRGEFSVTNHRSGLFRVLASGGNKAESGAVLAGFAGLLLGDKVREFNTLSRTTAYLSEVKYDSISVSVTRGRDLDIDLTEFVVQGPEVLLIGNGGITYQEGLPVLEQPLYISAQLGAKEKAAYLLNDLRQLSNITNEAGYYAGPSFSIRGTLRNPDSSELNRLLRQAAFGAFGFGRKPVDLDGERTQDDESGVSLSPERESLQDERDRTTDPDEQIIRSIFELFGDG